MLGMHFKTAVRFLSKNLRFSLINIIGLSVGTLCCLYIVLFVQDAYLYDRQHKQVDDIYRVTTRLVLTGDLHNNATASPPIAPAMKRDFPEVEQFTRVVNPAKLGSKEHLLQYEDKSFYEPAVLFTDSTFFNVFSYHFIAGDPATALQQPYTVVLLKPLAQKLFGRENPIGKVITVSDGFRKDPFKVTGVVDESLGKSHIQANMFMTMNSGGMGAYVLENQNWSGNNFTYSYVRLNPHSSAAALEKKLPAFLQKYGAEQLQRIGMEKELHLQPVKDVHTSTGYEVELSESISTTFLNVLLLIAVLIQVIACINFMNLATARSSLRAKEVGVRKVIGAGKGQLISQFLSESFVLAVGGVLLAIPLMLLALPWLNQVTGASIGYTLLYNQKVWMILAVVVVATGLLAGSYPAFYLSAFQAIKVIKGNYINRNSAAGIRRSLVVFQFVLSSVLIIGVVVIYQQLQYIRNKDLGFQKDQQLVFNFYTAGARQQIPAFMDAARNLSEVAVVSKADNYLGQFVGHDHGVYLEGGNMANSVNVKNISVDENFARANGIQVETGRDFRQHDSAGALINEALMRRLGLTRENAPGTRLYSQYGNGPADYVEVIGVMKDFNFNSLRSEVVPFMLLYEPERDDIGTVVMKVHSSNYSSLLGRIEQIWHGLMPGVPFEYSFLDEDVQRQYLSDITLSRIINSFTLIAILISCMGLFGLAAFSAEQRQKEISIRKVLGANMRSLVQLLSADFVKLVLIALVIAVPVSWWIMQQWLQGFAYRITISWWMFLLAGSIAICIALVIVGMQAVKAAVSNPVKSLR